MTGAPWSCAHSICGYLISRVTSQGNVIFIFMSTMLGMELITDKSLLSKECISQF